MKRPERLKLVEKIRAHLLITCISTGTDMALLKQAADCISQLENELDAIHENFLKESE